MEKKMWQNKGWDDDYHARWNIDEISEYNQYLAFVGRFAKEVAADKISGSIDHDFGNLDIAMRRYRNAEAFIKEIPKLKNEDVGTFEIHSRLTKEYNTIFVSSFYESKSMTIIATSPEKQFLLQIDRIIGEIL